MHTHHSHSGQFCQHAYGSLEEMVERAIDLKFELICLTEHMPRYDVGHMYPEEIASQTSVNDLVQTFENFIEEARRLQKKYFGQIDILVGFECEGISNEYIEHTQRLRDRHRPDLFLGSLHHSEAIPIDFDKTKWNQAVLQAGGVDQLVSRYFTRLQTVIRRLTPPVIAHYDLIRLFGPEIQLKGTKIWSCILDTIDLAIKSNCMFEINSAAVRKGWETPYPQRDITEVIISKGGKLCLSDDSHRVEQVGLNYHVVVEYLESLGVKEVWRLKKIDGKVQQVPEPLARIKQWVELIRSEKTK